MEEKRKAQHFTLEKVVEELDIITKTSENGYQSLLDELAEWEEEDGDTDLLIEAVEMDKKNQGMIIQYTVGMEEAAFIETCGRRPTTSSTADSSSTGVSLKGSLRSTFRLTPETA